MPEAAKLTWADARPCLAARSRRAEIARKTKKLLTSGEFPCPTAHIEKKLFLSRSTVQTYRMHLYQKLDIRNRQELLDIIEAADAG